MNIAHNNRMEAMKWWNGLTTKGKQAMCAVAYSDRQFSTLTGREIENLYRNHQSAYCGLLEEDIRN